MPAPRLRPVGPRITAYAAGHVLQRVVTDALGDHGGTGVANAEPLADDTAQVDLPAGGAVGDHVAGDDVALGGERCGLVRPYDETPAGQSLADVVVRVAEQPQGHAPRARTLRTTGRPSRGR